MGVTLVKFWEPYLDPMLGGTVCNICALDPAWALTSVLGATSVVNYKVLYRSKRHGPPTGVTVGL